MSAGLVEQRKTAAGVGRELVCDKISSMKNAKLFSGIRKTHRHQFCPTRTTFNLAVSYLLTSTQNAPQQGQRQQNQFCCDTEERNTCLSPSRGLKSATVASAAHTTSPLVAQPRHTTPQPFPEAGTTTEQVGQHVRLQGQGVTKRATTSTLEGYNEEGAGCAGNRGNSTLGPLSATRNSGGSYNAQAIHGRKQTRRAKKATQA